MELVEIKEEDERMLRRHKEFRRAAEYVAEEFARAPEVLKIALFGSVAKPLPREVPRFREFRRAGIAIYHECKDVDIAVWLENLDCLNSLQKARGQALNRLFQAEDVGVAHHQVDVFIFEPTTNRYLGRLCHFKACPNDKPECRVPRCGENQFLRQHEDFVLDPAAVSAAHAVTLYERRTPQGFV